MKVDGYIQSVYRDAKDADKPRLDILTWCFRITFGPPIASMATTGG